MADGKKKPEGGSKRKDRLIQTRVHRDLETTLKEEARRRRLSVSHLIRNVLEDTFHLVDGVITDVDKVVSDSVSLAKGVGRGVRRLTSPDPEEPDPPDDVEPSVDEDLSHVHAWNQVVLHQPASCSRCGCEIGRGETGFMGLSDDASAPRAWLCATCIEAL